MNAPTLATARLSLRAHRLEDFDAYAALWAGEEAHFMGGPLDRTQAWGMFCADVAAWQFFGFGAWAMERSSDGACVGQVVLNRLPHFAEPELGWLVHPAHRGQGYAAEGAAAARDWAFAEGRVATLVSYVDPGNRASARVAERIGGVLDPGAARPEPEDLVYRHGPGAHA